MATIGEASRRSGINIETIRYFEREGVVPRPQRSAAGRRVYSEDDITVLVFVAQCRKLGFTQSDIKALLALKTASAADCAEVLSIATQHRESVRNRIDELRRLDSALSALVADCKAGRTHCPAIEKLFSAPA